MLKVAVKLGEETLPSLPHETVRQRMTRAQACLDEMDTLFDKAYDIREELLALLSGEYPSSSLMIYQERAEPGTTRWMSTLGELLVVGISEGERRVIYRIPMAPYFKNWKKKKGKLVRSREERCIDASVKLEAGLVIHLKLWFRDDEEREQRGYAVTFDDPSHSAVNHRLPRLTETTWQMDSMRAGIGNMREVPAEGPVLQYSSYTPLASESTDFVDKRVASAMHGLKRALGEYLTAADAFEKLEPAPKRPRTS
jgi:hypothetical protein